MSNNRRLAIFVGIGLLLAAIVGVSIYMVGNQPQPTGQTPIQNSGPGGTDPTQPSATTSTDAGEVEASPFLGNLDVLASVYTDREYFFINQTVMEFSNNRLSKGSGISIDPVSFGQRSDGTYGFSVREDSTGNNLFYVVITRDPDGGIKVEEFL